VRYVAERVRPSLQLEIAHWIEADARFRDFLLTHRDKVRKKLSGSGDDEHRIDVRAELLLASQLLRDRRFEVVFEAYGAGRIGPDLSVTFRANQRFNLEVTRLRPSDSADVVGRLARVIAGKLRQLPADAPNVLAIAGSDAGAEDLAAALRNVKSRIDAKDDTLLARAGLDAARAYGQWLRLSGVLLLESGAFEANREGRRALSAEMIGALTQAMHY
jgi:hypothetical protein